MEKMEFVCFWLCSQMPSNLSLTTHKAFTNTDILEIYLQSGRGANMLQLGDQACAYLPDVIFVLWKVIEKGIGTGQSLSESF